MAPFALSEIQDNTGLALNLGCSVSDLDEFADPLTQRRLYEQYRIPKKGRRTRGDVRVVYKARQGLALAQKNIAETIAAHTTFAPCVQGFVAGRSIVTNARLHLGQREVLHADIADFFGSIAVDRVEKAFLSAGSVRHIAALLAKVCTLEGRLPQGSSASPVIANLVCQSLDTHLQQLAFASKCRYSRYADDITMSGNKVPGAAEVEAMLAGEGFTLNRSKWRVQRIGRCQYATGLTVFDKVSPRVGRAIKRRLRQELHYARHHGLVAHLAKIRCYDDPMDVLLRWHGWIAFMKSVEPHLAGALHKRWLNVNRAYWNEMLDAQQAEDEAGPDPRSL